MFSSTFLLASFSSTERPSRVQDLQASNAGIYSWQPPMYNAGDMIQSYIVTASFSTVAGTEGMSKMPISLSQQTHLKGTQTSFSLVDTTNQALLDELCLPSDANAISMLNVSVQADNSFGRGEAADYSQRWSSISRE